MTRSGGVCVAQKACTASNGRVPNEADQMLKALYDVNKVSDRVCARECDTDADCDQSQGCACMTGIGVCIYDPPPPYPGSPRPSG